MEKPSETQSKMMYEAVRRFFMESYGAPPDKVEKALWQILVAAMNSKDTDDLPPMDRADLLVLYKSLSQLVSDLHSAYEYHRV